MPLFHSLHQEFQFTLDAAASVNNAKCKKFYTVAQDGLKQDWTQDIVFCNPPYRLKIKNWVRKARETGKFTTVVMLLPARTDAQWFHEYIYHQAEIRFIKGRLRFSNHQNNAPFPSMIAIWHPSRAEDYQLMSSSFCRKQSSSSTKPSIAHKA